MKCAQCGTEFEGRFCSNCGTPVTYSKDITGSNSPNTIPPVEPTSQPTTRKKVKVKKPFYRRWWFVILAIILILIVVGRLNSGLNSRGEKFNWTEIMMSDVLPQPKSTTAQIWSNSGDRLSIFIYKTDSTDYFEYVTQCEEKGFTVDESRSGDSYEAYNASGYKLRISFWSYGDTYMNLDLNAPIKMTEIQWPSSTVAKLIPVPKSTTGKFSYENEDSFRVYIGNTSIADFNKYVTACSDKGFKVDYDKGDTYYYADNKNGYHVSVKYEGNNTMSISIDSPDEDKGKDKDKDEESPATISEEPTSTPVASESSKKENKKDDSKLVDGMRPDFKEAMDSYESFMDEYVTFMKKYAKSNGSDISLLSDYASYISKYADVVNKFDKWESDDMNSAETAYYIDVQARVSKKLLDVAQ